MSNQEVVKLSALAAIIAAQSNSSPSRHVLASRTVHKSTTSRPGSRAVRGLGTHRLFLPAHMQSCADSRVPPELIFDQGVGDIFVVRVAGNIVNPDVIASLHFAVENLGVKMIVVMGHTKVPLAAHLVCQARPPHAPLHTKAKATVPPTGVTLSSRTRFRPCAGRPRSCPPLSPFLSRLAPLSQCGAVKGAVGHVTSGAAGSPTGNGTSSLSFKSRPAASAGAPLVDLLETIRPAVESTIQAYKDTTGDDLVETVVRVNAAIAAAQVGLAAMLRLLSVDLLSSTARLSADCCHGSHSCVSACPQQSSESRHKPCHYCHASLSSISHAPALARPRRLALRGRRWP